MIIKEKLDKPYEEVTIRSLVWYKCDYCEKEFQRVKKSRERLNKNIQKDSCGEKSCSKLKQEEVCLVLYGTKTRFESGEFKQKLKEHNLAKHGCEEYFSSEEFQQKRGDTLEERLGVRSPLQNEEVKQKQRQTCKEIYGVENYAQTDEFHEKSQDTSNKHFGVPFPMQSEECKAKRDATCIATFGTKSYTQTDEYWINRKAKCKSEKGVEHESQLPENREKARKTCNERYNVDNYSQTDEFKERVTKTFMDNLGVPNPLCLKINQRYGKTQKEIAEWLNSLGCNFIVDDYSILGSKEIDMVDIQRRIAIEYTGLFWHTELSLAPRLKNYHYDKFKLCEQKDFRLITIFEDEWKRHQKQCEGILKVIVKKPDYITQARKCICKEIDKYEFNNFCNNHHLLGSNNLGIFFVGLYEKDRLLGAMSLGRHPRNSHKLTLDRLCFHGGTQIIGGAAKLFKKCVQFTKDRNHESIITWSDNRWSKGAIYEQLGFELDENLGPDYSYVELSKPYHRISKQSQKKSLTGCPPDITEKEWAAEQGLARIWDCGKKRWIYNV